MKAKKITAAEAGRLGGLIGGRSRSAVKLAAARRNGFQKAVAAKVEPVEGKS